jgi:hypothetical protein
VGVRVGFESAAFLAGDDIEAEAAAEAEAELATVRWKYQKLRVKVQAFSGLLADGLVCCGCCCRSVQQTVFSRLGCSCRVLLPCCCRLGEMPGVFWSALRLWPQMLF